MAKHRVYEDIVKAVNLGRLPKTFTNAEFEKACPGYRDGTYNAFLYKHREGNPSGETELFKLVSPGKFQLIRPLKYGLDK